MRGNRIYLNEHGRNFAVYAQNSINSLNSGIVSVKQSMYDMVGSLQIICNAFANAVMDSVVEYIRLNPKVKLSIYQHVEDASGRVKDSDFYLSATNQNFTGLGTDAWVSQSIITERHCLVISPRYRSFPDDVTGLRLSDLKEDMFIGMPVMTDFFSDITYKICQSSGFAPKIFCYTEDFLLKARLIDAGQAIAIIPSCCLSTLRNLSPDVRHFEILDHDTVRTLYLVRRRESQMTETARDFWNFAMNYYHVDTPPLDV